MPLYDPTDFESLYKATFNALSQYVFFKVAQISDAQDIVQNIYSDFYTYVHRKGKVIDHVEAYLIQMAKHELQQYYKKKKNLPLLDETEDQYLLESIEDPHDLEVLTFNKFELEAILLEIKHLSLLDQKILGAKFRYELNFKEIAQRLDLSENTIKTRYYRALQQLKSRLNQ